jgi:hypothetical protein
MTKVYKFNIFNDNKEIYTKSPISPFLNINPIYIKTNEDNIIKKIMTFVAEFIFSDKFTNKNINILKFKVLKYDYKYTDEKLEIIQYLNEIENMYKVINLLTYYASSLIIIEMSTGKLWNDIYISLDEIEEKGSNYTDDEIKKYIENNFNI